MAAVNTRYRAADVAHVVDVGGRQGPNFAQARTQSTQDTNVFDALRTLPIATLLQAAKTRDPSRVEDMSLYFGPVLDGRRLPRHPFHPEAPPQSADIPMIIGNTRDETRAFLGNDPANHALTWAQPPRRRAGPGEHEAGDIAEVVAGIGEQGQRAGLPAVEGLNQDKQHIERNANGKRTMRAQ